MHNKLKATIGSVALVILAGCGGGGGGSPAATPPPATTAEGLWSGTTSDFRTMTGVVLNSGAFWVIYSSPNNSATVGGLIEGTGASLNGNFSSSDAKDFSMEGTGIVGATMSSSYVAKQTLNGSISYPTLNQVSTFVSTYNTAYDQTPSLATIAGTYTGSVFQVMGTEGATVTVTSSGTLSGTGGTGCQFTGTVAPDAHGNVYDLTVTFGGGVCSNGTSTETGVGYFNAAKKTFYGAALNSARTNGFIFVGFLP